MLKQLYLGEQLPPISSHNWTKNSQKNLREWVYRSGLDEGV